MSSGERPMGTAEDKQPNTEALCQTPPPSTAPLRAHAPQLSSFCHTQKHVRKRGFRGGRGGGGIIPDKKSFAHPLINAPRFPSLPGPLRRCHDIDRNGPQSREQRLQNSPSPFRDTPTSAGHVSIALT